MLVRALAAIVLVTAAVAALFAFWPSGSQQESSLIPTSVTVYAPGLTAGRLVACEQLWEKTGGHSSLTGFTSNIPQNILLPFLHAARRLAQADLNATSERVFKLYQPVADYLRECRSFHFPAS
jgi:hypothetical protein